MKLDIRKLSPAILLGTAILFLTAPYSWTAPREWDDATGDWFTATNWNPDAVPTAADSARINNGGQANINGGNAVADDLFLGQNAGNDGTLGIRNGGQIAIDNFARVGDGGTGTLLVRGSGSSTIGTDLIIGRQAGSIGRVEIRDFNLGFNLTVGATTVVGNSGDGFLDVLDGGGLFTTGNATIGNQASGTGMATVVGDLSIWIIDSNLTVGVQGQGDLEIRDFGFVVVSGDLAIARGAGSMGRVVVDGGASLSTSDIFVGGGAGAPGGQGSLRITNGGAVTGANVIVWGAGSGGKSALIVDSTYTLNDTSLRFEGGVLRFLDDTDFINDAVLGNSQPETGVYVDTNATTSTISGTFSGPGELHKRDIGTLILTADNTYTGDTVVENGTLIIDGSVAADTRVREDATLAGVWNGVFDNVGGNLLSRGTVSPGDFPGDAQQFHVLGDYRTQSPGQFIAEIGGLSEGFDSDLLRSHSNVDIDGGTLQAIRINNFNPSPGDRVTVIRADGTRTGEFDTFIPVNWFGLIQPRDDYSDPQTVDIVFDLVGNFLGQALTRNQECVAENLDHIFFETDFLNIPGANDLITFLGNLPVGDLPFAFELISPDEYSALYNISFAHAAVQNTNLQRRMSDIRAGSDGYCGPSVELITADYKGPAISDKNVVIPDKNVAPMPVAGCDPRLGVWAMGTGQWVKVDDNAQHISDSSFDGEANPFGPNGYEISTGGFITGVDYRVSKHVAVGLTGAFASSEADLDDSFSGSSDQNGIVEVDGGKFGAYATFYGGGFYVDVAASAGWNDYNLRRTGLAPDDTGSFISTETLHGDTDGFEWNGMIGGGYDFRFGCFNIGPTATFQYTHVEFDSFTEHSSDSSDSSSSTSFAGLHFPTQDEASARGTLGVKAEMDWRAGGVIIRPELRAAWQHEFEDTENAIRWAFDSSIVGEDRHFCNVFGPDLGEDSAMVGGGLAILWGRCHNVSTYAYYDGNFGRENFESHAVSGGVRVGF